MRRIEEIKNEMTALYNTAAIAAAKGVNDLELIAIKVRYFALKEELIRAEMWLEEIEGS